jgi:hypothetical protein
MYLIYLLKCSKEIDKAFTVDMVYDRTDKKFPRKKSNTLLRSTVLYVDGKKLIGKSF